MFAMLLRFDIAFEDSPEIMSSRNDGMSVLAELDLAYTINKRLFL